MENNTYKKVTWECGECKTQHESFSNIRWDMQICDCGKSGYDLEEHYSRTMGSVKLIKEETLIENKNED